VNKTTRVMPAETFGCAAHFFSPSSRLDDVYAMHMFRWVGPGGGVGGGSRVCRRVESQAVLKR